MMQKRLWGILALSALLSGAQTQTWTEQGDAGDLPETAQSTGTGPINRIVGTHGTDDVDMYAIYIANPATFSATTVGGASLDTQLWLFDASGRGVVFNDDWRGSSQSRIDNSTSCIPGPGLYYLAISGYNQDAFGCNGGLIWTDDLYTSIRCPNGPEATSRVARWEGNAASGGSYTIFLTGVTGASAGDPDDCPPPEPWDETANGGGDAGHLPATAQIVHLPSAVHCQTPVQRIRGELGDNDVDMYVICIPNPANFVATTIGGTTFDTQLWLFRCNGTGVVANDDAGGTLQSRIDNSIGCINAPGIYLLAISRYNRDPVDANGAPLWSSGALSCATNSNPIAGWINPSAAAGRYTILLQGAYFVRSSGCQEPPPCQPHNGDVDNNGCIDDADLLRMLLNFGRTGSDLGRADVNCDGVVDDADLLRLLIHFGRGC